jgi:hypothetical protein
VEAPSLSAPVLKGNYAIGCCCGELPFQAGLARVIAEKYRKMNMASGGNQDPISNLMDKFRANLNDTSPKATLRI